jgi:hypothetical protein
MLALGVTPGDAASMRCAGRGGPRRLTDAASPRRGTHSAAAASGAPTRTAPGDTPLTLSIDNFAQHGRVGFVSNA